jgi:hypothetical protein
MADAAERVDVSLPELRALLRDVIDAVPMRQVPDEFLRRLRGGATSAELRKPPTEEEWAAADRAIQRARRKRQRRAG